MFLEYRKARFDSTNSSGLDLASQAWCGAGARTDKKDIPMCCGRFCLIDYSFYNIFGSSQSKFLSLLASGTRVMSVFRRRVLIETVVPAAVLLGACLAVAQPPAGKPVWLADKHVASGLTCASCHGDARPSDVGLDTCLSCHGSYRELARKTASRPRNPHDSHYPGLECTTCHHGHQKEENFCAGCHGQD
jgi:hypothetical protein